MTTVTPSGNVPQMPRSVVVREISAIDAALPADSKFGFNASDFDEIVITATLLGGATAAALELFYWSEAKNGTPNGGFVPGATAETISVTSSGQRKIFRVAGSGSVWVNCSSITGGSGARVRVEVGGVPVYGQRGL